MIAFGDCELGMAVGTQLVEFESSKDRKPFVHTQTFVYSPDPVVSGKYPAPPQNLKTNPGKVLFKSTQKPALEPAFGTKESPDW
jgi:hypothetical protein